MLTAQNTRIINSAVWRALGNGGLEQVAFFSSGSKGSKKTYRPRRKPNPKYRPVQHKLKTVKDPLPGNPHKFVDLGDGSNLGETLGPMREEILTDLKRERLRKLENPMYYHEEQEEQLRSVDAFLAREGSLEEQVIKRRGLETEFDTDEERQAWLNQMKKDLKEYQMKDMSLDEKTLEDQYIDDVVHDEKQEEEIENTGNSETDFDPDAMAHGEWGEMMITVDRTAKLWRGGRLYSYRALVIGGNLNGCGGFAVGKAKDPIDAVANASRKCKRNIFFLDRFHGKSLCQDLVGKCNDVKMVIRATNNGKGWLFFVPS